MTRVQANALLFLTAFIWGVSFVAQKSAMDEVGPFTFIALRFAISFLTIAPFIFRTKLKWDILQSRSGLVSMLFLCGSFVGGVFFQQIGVVGTTVSNAGFLTSLYVVLIVFISWIVFRVAPQWVVFVTAPLSFLGVWLLGDASFSKLMIGDYYIIASAFFFALNAVMLGHILLEYQAPIFLAVTQYAICAILAAGIAMNTEVLTVSAVINAGPSILFAGILSGGVAFTCQIFAQQYTSPSHAGVILSCEALFAALAGVMIMGDNLSILKWSGCGLIMVAVVLTVLNPDKKFSVETQS